MSGQSKDPGSKALLKPGHPSPFATSTPFLPNFLAQGRGLISALLWGSLTVPEKSPTMKYMPECRFRGPGPPGLASIRAGKLEEPKRTPGSALIQTCAAHTTALAIPKGQSSEGIQGKGKRVWPESWFPPPLPTPPPLSLLCPASGHSYPAGGPAAVPPPQGSEQPLHGAAGLHDVRRLAGVPTAGLNNAGARPGASWKRPGGGSRFPWVEGRLSGWCEEKPGPGSGGECRRERGRSLLQEVGGGGEGGCGGGQEIRFPGSTLLGVSARDLLRPPPQAPLLWSCLRPRDPSYPGICKDPEIQPPVGWGGGRVGI